MEEKAGNMDITEKKEGRTVKHGECIISTGSGISYTIKNPSGIHARPAAQMIKLAGEFKSRVELSANGRTVSLDNIIGIMSLNIQQGTEIRIDASGEDSREALAAMSEFLRNHL